MKTPFLHISLSSALLALALLAHPATAEPEAEASAVPPDAAERIHFTRNGKIRFDSRVEWTERGAVVRFEGEMVMESRPMSEREKALRIEAIRSAPIGDVEPTAEEEARLETIQRILARTNPIHTMRPVQEALQESFHAWKSPLRFEAIYLDPAFQPDPTLE